jgi:aldose sugar dehydrogenase
MTTLRIAALLLAVASTRADAQVNAGKRKAEPSLPFTITRVAAFNLPWRVAFRPTVACWSPRRSDPCGW